MDSGLGIESAIRILQWRGGGGGRELMDRLTRCCSTENPKIVGVRFDDDQLIPTLTVNTSIWFWKVLRLSKFNIVIYR